MWEPYFAVAVVGLLLAALVSRVAAADYLAAAALALVAIVADLSGSALLPSAAELVTAFGNSGLVTLAVLYVVVTGLEMTGATQWATGWWLSRSTTLTGAQIRLLGPVAALSAFLNNTPVVAALIPVVGDLARRIGIAPSRLLLPMSYATILGGTATLIGTSTNLIVADQYALWSAANPAAAATPLTFFSPAIVAVPATILGLAYIIVASRFLIPDRRAAVSAGDDPRQYTVELEVDPAGPLVGRTIADAGLRSLPGLYVAEIQRANDRDNASDDRRIDPAKPAAVLGGGDTLILVGNLDSVVDLKKIRGLITPDDQSRKLAVPSWRRTLVEAVVSPRCSLLGKTIREGRFRSHYNAAVVAVARGDRRLRGKLGDVRLESGDVLLLEASPSFLHRRRDTRDFFMVSRVGGGEVRRHERAPIAIAILVGMIFVAATQITPLLPAAMVAAIAMVTLRCCTMTEARRGIDWSLLILVGSMIGIGTALEKTGAAKTIADGMIALGGGNAVMTLIAVYLATLLCTELITNTAAALLMFPIAIEASTRLPAGQSIPPAAMTIAVMVAASASFLTPFGYQTNTMVFTVGGYRPLDYLRFGAPLSILVMTVTIWVLT